MKGFDPKQTILIDDNVDPFSFQKRNGVQCSSDVGNEKDAALSLLSDFLSL